MRPMSWLKKALLNFAEREIDPVIKSMENYEYPRETLRSMGKLGLWLPWDLLIKVVPALILGPRY